MTTDLTALLLALSLCTCLPVSSYCQGQSPGRLVHAQLESNHRDSLLLYALPEVSVTGAEVNRSVAIPAPIKSLYLDGLPQYDNTTLLPALNRVAGVRFEERAAASYRVAIRGASLRAPFGVRNVQVFWNGIPFGEPGGDVPLNFLDNINIKEATVIRGPNGGRYGAGTAGTLLLSTNRGNADTTTLTQFGMTAGSYGLFRADALVVRPNKLGSTDELRLGYQRADGFREHNAMERATIQYSSNLGRQTKLHALYTKLDYELPGGLNAQQAAENPRQARPGSVDTDASIHYHNLLLGLTNRKKLGRWKAETAAYATGFYFDHPFNFDYKREANLGTGGRFSISREWSEWALNAGAQGQLQYRTGQNFENNDGMPGELNFSDEILSEQGFVYGQVRYAPGKFDFQADLSSSTIRYRVDRTFDAGGNAGIANFSTSRPLALRLAAGYRFGSYEQHYLYAARADGFSPPTLDEFRTNEGSLNLDLRPEIGTNYELGYRYNTRFVDLEAIGFLFALDEAITTFTDDRGTQLFRNAGRTRQLGLELTADFNYITKLFGGIVGGMATYTHYDFTYRDLSRRGTDFSGQLIPGAAPHTVNLELGWRKPQGPYCSIFHNFTDATPLNDANDVFARSFHLMRLTVGYEKMKYNVFVSANNVLNDELNLGYDLNVRFGGRYFQPAPGRTFLAGVKVTL